MENVKLKELVDIFLGVTHTPEYVFDGVPFLSVKDISDGEISFDDCKYISQEEYDSLSEGAKPKVGDMLFCRVGTLGKPIIIPEGTPLFGSFVSLGYLRNKDASRCDMNYLRYWMYSNSFWQQVNANVKGASQVNLNTGWLSKFDVVLPEMEQQKYRIATLDQCNMIIRKRKQQIEELDALIKARFVELFGDPVRNSMEWETYQLDECLERIDNGKSFVCSDKPREDNYPAVLKLSAATYGDYRPSENKALLDEKQFVESAEVHAGDLLFTRKNTPELVGMAAYVQETPSKLMMPDLIFRLVPNEKMNAVFLWQLINCKEFRPVIQAISGGSAKSMSNISKERLGKIKVICPPRELQDSLVPFIKQVDKSKVTVQKSLKETQQLFDGLMQKYFE